MSKKAVTSTSSVTAERPILFQTEMVKAILEGIKTQTRRTRGLDSINADPNFWNRKGDPRKNTVRLWDSTKESNPNPLAISFGFKDPIDSITYIKSQYGKPGDLLWVRETFHVHGKSENGVPSCVSFKAQAVDPKDKGWTWKPSIHMPKEACRIWLMVEDIRVERVQEISEEDAKAEGANFDLVQHGYLSWRSYRAGFSQLWISINGEESWKANPWVWVIQFRVLSKSGKPSLDVIERNYLEVTGKEVSND